MIQKYPSAYYCWIQHRGCEREHYMMFEGIRTRHSTKEEVIELQEDQQGTRLAECNAMNERIKELLKQVGGYGTKALMHPDDVEKFAKLIMEECANACNDFDCGRTMSAQELIGARFGVTL